jgi:hypothetical protein
MGPVPIDATNAAEKAKAVKAGEIPGPAKSLAEAVCRVMGRVGYVQKDKQMQGGGSYKYVSVEAVIDALRPEMVKEGLVMLPAGVEPLTVEHFEGKNGGRQNRTQVIYKFNLIHSASGQNEPVVVIGEAIDVGDKSSNKAMTAARKYALIMAFNIETGIDPDDTPSQEQERAPAKQPAAAAITLAQQVARLTTEYAQAKGADKFAELESKRSALWPDLSNEFKASLKAAADDTRKRLNLKPAGVA